MRSQLKLSCLVEPNILRLTQNYTHSGAIYLALADRRVLPLPKNHSFQLLASMYSYFRVFVNVVHKQLLQPGTNPSVFKESKTQIPRSC